MKIRFKAIIAKEVGAMVRNVTTLMENFLEPVFSEDFFGESIDQFIVTIVCIDNNGTLNEQYAKPHNKVGRFKHIGTGEQVKYVSVALAFSFDAVSEINDSQFKELLCTSLLDRIKNIDLKLPKKFDEVKFFAKLEEALMLYDAAK